MNLITFDIGGTQIKYGIVTTAGEVLLAQLCDTPKTQGGAGLIAKMLELAAPLKAEYAAQGVAISTFGLVDAVNGIVIGATEAVPGYSDNTAVKAKLEDALQLPVSIDNDVNCVALAESWRGAAQGVAHFIAVAIGTGIGGGIVIDEKVYRGHRAAAGEWGYMWIDGLLWEDHASMRGLIQAVQQTLGESLDGRAIFARYDQHDAQITPVVAAWFKLLARGLANLIYAFNPERLVIGGGISARGEAFLLELQNAVRDALQPDFQNMTEIVLASAGNHAGMLGAARWWLNNYSNNKAV